MKLCLVACILLAGLFFGAGHGKEKGKEGSEMPGMTDDELRRIRDGFDQRVQQAFEAKRGKPLVRAKKRPPLRPGRGNYVRHYSFSIVEFATRCFILGEQIDEANAALVENAQHYLDNPKDIDDRDSFHWHSEMLCRLIDLYGAKGSVAPGRMTAETEERVMESLWRYAWRSSKVADAEVEQSRTWHVHESENHHAQIFTTAWHFAKLAKESPGFRDRKYEDGFTVAEHHAAWTEYIKAYCTERAKKGLFVEVASDGYNGVLLKGLYNVLDFAEDPELRRRVGCLLDLYWATWAEEQIDGVRGGGKARIYQTGGDRMGGGTHIWQLAWFYFGLGEPRGFGSPLLSALTSAYRPPLVVIDLACDVAGRGRYAVHQRPLGLAEPGYNAPPDYRLRTDTGGIHRYTWCTPAFIMGTLMVEPRPMSDWTHISSQNRWHGVVFAGHPDARIVPQCQAADGRVAHNAQWSVESQGTLICQMLWTSKGGSAMRVWFSTAGLANRTEEAGWVFAEAAEAYAGVRVVRGGTDWEPSTDRFKGDWLRCRDQWSPVILEVACKEDFADYAAFREAVAALPLSVEKDGLTYRGLGGDEFKFFNDQRRPPEVNGKPVDYAPPQAFDSPFVRAKWNSGVVTITKDGRTLVLDFNQP